MFGGEKSGGDIFRCADRLGEHARQVPLQLLYELLILLPDSLQKTDQFAVVLGIAQIFVVGLEPFQYGSAFYDPD